MTTYRTAGPRRTPVTGTGRRLFEQPRGAEPEWVAEARALRRQRWSYQRIADHLGKSYRQVYVRLNRERVRQTDMAADRRNRKRITAAARKRLRKHAPRCASCNRKLSKPPRVLPAVCLRCRRAEGQRKSAILAGLFLAGYTYKEIAEATGYSSANAVGSRISDLRKEGWDLPQRQPFGRGRSE